MNFESGKRVRTSSGHEGIMRAMSHGWVSVELVDDRSIVNRRLRDLLPSKRPQRGEFVLFNGQRAFVIDAYSDVVRLRIGDEHSCVAESDVERWTGFKVGDYVDYNNLKYRVTWVNLSRHFGIHDYDIEPGTPGRDMDATISVTDNDIEPWTEHNVPGSNTENSKIDLVKVQAILTTVHKGTSGVADANERRRRVERELFLVCDTLDEFHFFCRVFGEDSKLNPQLVDWINGR